MDCFISTLTRISKPYETITGMRRQFMSKLLIMFFPMRFAITAALMVVISSYSPAWGDPNPPMSFAKNGDVNIAYRVVGNESSEPVIMIMGLSASHKIWHSKLVEGLVDGGYRVVLSNLESRVFDSEPATCRILGRRPKRPTCRPVQLSSWSARVPRCRSTVVTSFREWSRALR